MIYTGIDYHKRYSVACTLDAQGHKLHEARIDGNAAAAFAAYFKHLGSPSEVVIGPRRKGSVRYVLILRESRRQRVRHEVFPAALARRQINI